MPVTSITVKARGKMLVLRFPLTSDNVRLINKMPDVAQHAANTVIFKATLKAISYVANNFPSAQWDEQSMSYRAAVEKFVALQSSHKPRPDFGYKTVPFKHQRETFEKSRSLPVYAVLFEMGCGKTKVILDTAAYLFSRGMIQGLLVVSRSGVHENWVTDEIPAHLPEWTKYVAASWNARKKGSKSIAPLYKAKDDQLVILTMNVEAFSTPRGVKEAEKFLSAFPCLLAIDEATCIKNPKAKRTQSLIKLSPLAPYRRILTGSIITKSPLDVYSPFEFLDPSILGFGSFFSFRARYAIMKAVPGKVYRGRPIEVPVGWQNLDELREKIKPYSTRVLKKDCTDLPNKIYLKQHFEMTDEMWSHYLRMEDEMFTEFESRQIQAQIKLTMRLRLAQIASGYLPSDDPDVNPGISIHSKNPRVQFLMEAMEEHKGSKIIIFSNFRAALRDIWKEIVDNYGKSSIVIYKGGMTQEQKLASRRRFMDDPNTLFFLGQTAASGYGLTLTATDKTYFFNNGDSWEHRIQAEDRTHRISQLGSPTYTDIPARGTIDEKILKHFAATAKLAALIQGDATQEELDKARKEEDEAMLEMLWTRASH